MERKFYLKIEELEQIIKAQNENYKDLETQYQNKAKLQIKEFEDELIKQKETFNIKLENFSQQLHGHLCQIHIRQLMKISHSIVILRKPSSWIQIP